MQVDVGALTVVYAGYEEHYVVRAELHVLPIQFTLISTQLGYSGFGCRRAIGSSFCLFASVDTA